MISFTDQKLYVKGICQVVATDPNTGDVLFASNKFNTGNITFSVNSDPLRAGLGNGIATIVESDPDVTVSFTQANFDLATKMAAVGGSVSYNAIGPVCQTVTAADTTLAVDVTDGVPAANYGHNAAYAYVQTVGESSSIYSDGTPYVIRTDGVIEGFTAVAGTTYKVWYFTAKTASMLGNVNSMLNGKVVHFQAQLAVYKNVNTGSNQGTRSGWLYIIVPLLKLTAEGATVTGDQANYDTTNISGRAISYDEEVVSGTCSECGTSDLVKYVYVPDEGADEINGLVVIGGAVSVNTGATAQIRPFFVMANDQLVPVEPTTRCTYTATGEPSGTTVSEAGLITAGDTAGDFEVVVSYDNNGETLTFPVNVSVVSA